MPITKASGQAVAVAAKGDLVVGSATNDAAVLGVGSNDQVLTADSSTTTGLKWAAVSGGAGNMVQIATGTLSGASVQISSLSSYTNLFLVMYNCTNSTANGRPRFTLNNNTTSNYTTLGGFIDTNGRTKTQTIGGANAPIFDEPMSNSNTNQAYTVYISNAKNAGFTNYQIVSFGTTGVSSGIYSAQGIFTVSAAVSSIEISNSGGNWSAGTYTLWGA